MLFYDVRSYLIPVIIWQNSLQIKKIKKNKKEIKKKNYEV